MHSIHRLHGLTGHDGHHGLTGRGKLLDLLYGLHAGTLRNIRLLALLGEAAANEHPAATLPRVHLAALKLEHATTSAKAAAIPFVSAALHRTSAAYRFAARWLAATAIAPAGTGALDLGTFHGLLIGHGNENHCASWGKPGQKEVLPLGL